MTPALAAAADRVTRLAATLAELKDRVRVAVAGEAGRAVADVVRDLLTAALAGRLSAPATGPYCPPSRSHWDDDEPARDPWADPDDSDDEDEPAADPGRWRAADPQRAAVAPPAPTRWPAAVAVGAGVARWWAARQAPAWAALGAGLAAGAAALLGGPLARAGLALLAAAADLLPLAGPPPAWAAGTR